jgi:hypothetical protein
MEDSYKALSVYLGIGKGLLTLSGAIVAYVIGGALWVAPVAIGSFLLVNKLEKMMTSSSFI